MDVQVREARESELDEIGELTVEVYREGLVSDQYLPVLADARSRWAAEATTTYVALDGGTDGLPGRQLLGAVLYAAPGSPWRDIGDGAGEAEFRMLAVLRSARGRGVGEALVRTCIARARAERLERLVLSTAPDMKAAQRLYERLRFVRAEHRDWLARPTSRTKLLAYELDLE
jgi:ribosomal protein S18 acetylase RimI-like enzyme